MALNSQQQKTANQIYTTALRSGVTPARARELVAAAYAESTLNPRATNKSSGAAGVFQLLSSGYVQQANRRGGVYNTVANTKAILPEYVRYWRSHPGARPGEAGAAVEASGEGSGFYSKPLGILGSLGRASALGAMAPPGYTPGTPAVPGRRPISVAPGLALQIPAQRIPGFNLNSNHWAQQFNQAMRSLDLPTTNFGNLSGASQKVAGAKYRSAGFSIPGTPGIPGTPPRARTTAAGRTMPLIVDGMGSYPLARKGKIIGTPYAGTHNLGNWESDRAVDIAVPKGTPVRAMASGTIGSQIGALNSSDPHMLGLRVHLKFGGNEAYYAHLSRLTVKAGQKVKKGQIIGYSGAANGVNHLHLGLKKGNPLSFV